VGDESGPNAAATIVFVSLALAMAYTVVRDHIAGPVSWKDLPFFMGWLEPSRWHGGIRP
jgi:hypothetical protein